MHNRFQSRDVQDWLSHTANCSPGLVRRACPETEKRRTATEPDMCEDRRTWSLPRLGCLLGDQRGNYLLGTQIHEQRPACAAEFTLCLEIHFPRAVQREPHGFGNRRSKTYPISMLSLSRLVGIPAPFLQLCEWRPRKSSVSSKSFWRCRSNW